MRRAALLLAIIVLTAAPATALLLPAPQAAAPWGVDTAQALLHKGAWFGRSPAAWIAWGEAELARAAPARSGGDLVAAVEALQAAVGLAPSEAQRGELRERARSLPEPERAALAPLVDAAVRATLAQAEAAATVDVAAAAAAQPAWPAAAAEATVRTAEDVLGAVAAFRAAAGALPAEARIGFADPLGVVVVGGDGPDVFLPGGALGDPVVLADLGGDDLDYTGSGAACPVQRAVLDLRVANCNGLPFALRLDLAGNDQYLAARANGFGQGAGLLGGLGMLVDAAGDDHYQVLEAPTFTPGLLLYVGSAYQGAGEAGMGLLLDAAGHDHYQADLTSRNRVAYIQAQGFSALGGVGVLLDAAGDDRYTSDVTCSGSGWCGLYIDGVAQHAGVGLILDQAGDDQYLGSVVGDHPDYYAQAFANQGGLGIQVDRAGDDRWVASERSFLGGPFGRTLNCAYGSSFPGGTAIFLEGGGDDSYLTEAYDPVRGAYTMAEGFALEGDALFWDAGGDDVHRMIADGPYEILGGRGQEVVFGYLGAEVVAFYLDSGGVDVYADEPADQTIGRDGGVWVAGIDTNLAP